MRIYEHKTFENFEEKDPNFNKIIVHIERLLKITTAQTLAIDSLERKIIVFYPNIIVFDITIIPARP